MDRGTSSIIGEADDQFMRVLARAQPSDDLAWSNLFVVCARVGTRRTARRAEQGCMHARPSSSADHRASLPALPPYSVLKQTILYISANLPMLRSVRSRASCHACHITTALGLGA
jgi:hypothetical protein